MTRYRLAILDDEPLIALGLKKIITHLDHPRIGEITTYTNPKVALERLKSHPPDILFTDIKMPGMTGLDMVDSLRGDDIEILTVILSGYDEFPLVQKALRLGCHDYLRKPASTEEIERVLDRTVLVLDNSSREESGLMGQLKKLQKGEVEHLLYRIYREEIPPQESLSRIMEFGYTLFSGDYFILVLTEASDKQDGLSFDRGLESLVEMKGTVNRYHTQLESTGYRSLSLISGCRREDIEDLLIEIETLMDGQSLGDATLSCSQTFVGLDSLPAQLREMKLSRLGKFSLSPTPLLRRNRPGALKEELPGHIPDGDMIFFTRFGLSLDRRDFTGCREELKKIMRIWEEKRDESERYKFLKGTYNRLGEELEKHLGKQSALLSMDDHQTPIQLFENLDQVLLEKEVSETSQESRIIHRAKEFIHRHYGDMVDMTALAEELNISYSYFSTLFRQTCSTTFQEYLAAYRMDIAAELLRNTALSVQNIAKQVGYTHSRHFSRTFKKHTGKTPSDYRNSVIRR